MVDLIVSLIIVLLIIGFILWIWTKVKPLIASFVAEPFMGIVDVLVYILVGAIVIFYVIIPLLKTLAHSGSALLH